MHRTRTALLLACAAIALPAMPAPTPAAADSPWFVTLTRDANGRMFCADPTTTFDELAAAIADYRRAHPEVAADDREQTTLRALGERFPCTAAARAAAGAGASPARPGPPIWIAPIFSQLLATTAPAGFAAAPVYEATLPGARYVRSAVLEGETAERWSQMITITGSEGLAHDPAISPERIAVDLATDYRSRCPATYTGVSLPAGRLGGFDAYTAIYSCGRLPLAGVETSETAMVLVLKGLDDYYTVQWAERGPPTDRPLPIDAERWMRRFRTLAPIRLCARVAGEGAPYPSCTGRH